MASAWKQFFFFDCLGLSGVIGRFRGEIDFDVVDFESSTSPGVINDGFECETARLAKRTPRGSTSITIDNNSAGEQTHDIQQQQQQQQTHLHQRKRLDCSPGVEGAAITGIQRRSQASNKFRKQQNDLLAAKPKVRSPYNKALIQTDPLFHLYLICVGLITLSILAIKCLIPGMPIYSHTVIGFVFLLGIILVSTIYTQFKSKKHPSCAVMFASIPNYESFYTENNLNEQGLRCLQVLNEIICDFDQLLSHPAFRKIEKIKTIGSTYMAACFDVTRRISDCTLDGPETPHTPDIGLKTGWSNPLISEGTGCSSGGGQSGCSSPRVLSNNQMQFRGGGGGGGVGINRNRNSLHLDELAINNVVTMVCFATALMENLARMNKDAWQEFRLRIGIAIGPVIAGVVGASKPTYDIWGDTVNVASRLESSGVLGRIQVSEQAAQILAKQGQFEVECRGLINVKGKGRLTTYLVVTPYDSLPESPGRSERTTEGGLNTREMDLNSMGEPEEIMEDPPEVVDQDEVEELGADVQKL